MFSFEWPWMAAILPLPLLIRYLLPSSRQAQMVQAPDINFPYTERLRMAFSGGSGPSKPFSNGLFILLFCIWICLVGALMQPQLTDQFTNVKSEGYDLMLAVDLSGSMKALDFATRDNMVTRVDVVKATVGKFVGDRKGDRIGLILFGSNAYLRVPLTYDTLSVGKMLDNMMVGEAGDATAIGDAIGVAVRNLRDRPAHSRVLVLLTDGGDNASTIPPLQAAKLAAQYGIRVYTVGVGSNGLVPIADRNGNIVMAEFDLDEDLLKKIADMTGGSYFRATDTTALQQIYAHINTLEKSKSESRTYLIHDPLYRYPLGMALVLLLLLAGIPLRKKVVYGQ